MNTSSIQLSSPEISAAPVSNKAGQTVHSNKLKSDAGNENSSAKAPFDRVLNKQINDRSPQAANSAANNKENKLEASEKPPEGHVTQEFEVTDVLPEMQLDETAITKVSPETTAVTDNMLEESPLVALNIAQVITNPEAKGKNSVTQPEEAELESSQTTRAIQNPSLLNSPASKSSELEASDEILTNNNAFQVGGKIIPPSGKNLPGSQNHSTEGPGSGSENNTGKPTNALNSNPITDFINKSVDYSQQLTKTAETKIDLATNIQTTSAAALNIDANSLAVSDKPVNPRIQNIGTLENTATLNVAHKAGSQEWASEVGNRIRWMGKINITSAELQLHPAELGSMEIKISTKDDQSTISFVTSNSAAKEAIEASLPKLRELLANSGLQLAQSDVSQHPSSNNNGDTQKTQAQQDSLASNESEADDVNTEQVIQQQKLGKIDHYV